MATLLLACGHWEFNFLGLSPLSVYFVALWRVTTCQPDRKNILNDFVSTMGRLLAGNSKPLCPTNRMLFPVLSFSWCWADIYASVVFQGPVEFPGRHHHSRVPCNLGPSYGGLQLFHCFSKSNVGSRQLSVRPQHHYTLHCTTLYYRRLHNTTLHYTSPLHYIKLLHYTILPRCQVRRSRSNCVGWRSSHWGESGNYWPLSSRSARANRRSSRLVVHSYGLVEVCMVIANMLHAKSDDAAVIPYLNVLLCFKVAWWFLIPLLQLCSSLSFCLLVLAHFTILLISLIVSTFIQLPMFCFLSQQGIQKQGWIGISKFHLYSTLVYIKAGYSPWQVYCPCYV